MKRTIIYITAALGMTLAGCNGIAEDDRYIDVEAPKVDRTVLLEDFTGQNCVNCPAAHRVIEALEEQYSGHLVAVSIHAGHFGIAATNKRYTGLMQEDGQTYNSRYGIEDYPKGVLDGRLPALNPDQWAWAVYQDISTPTPVTIVLGAALNAAGTDIEIDCKVSSSEEIDGNLVVWVVESGIVARQEDINEGRINDYVHNNVFRACVNGIDGTRVKLAIGESSEHSYTIALKKTDTEKWTAENLGIVAFVKTATGVAQAARTNVKTNNE